MRGIRLKNFRSFEDTGWIDLRPITVLVGANSSGKSSFLRFFPLLRQTYEEAPSSPLLWYGRYVDFGDFSGAARRGAVPREIELELHYEHPSDVEYALRTPVRISVRLGEREGKTVVLGCSIGQQGVSCDLHVDSAEQSGRLVAKVGADVVSEIELGMTMGEWKPGLIPVWRPRQPDPYAPLVKSPVDPWLDELCTMMEVATQGKVTRAAAESVIRLAGIAKLEAMLHSDEQNEPSVAAYVGLAARTFAQLPREDSAPMRRLRALALGVYAWEILQDAWADIGSESGGNIYIGPFRQSPARFYRFQELPTAHIMASGENLAMFLRSLSADELEQLSAFVSRYFGYCVRLHTEGGHVSILLEDESRAPFNLIDSGYGFSQVLPIIAQCWAIVSGRLTSKRYSRGSLLSFEQPELHLHPYYQALLGDMFAGVISTVRGASNEPRPVRILVETHSEALVNRLGELVEEGKLATEDVSVLLFEKDPKTGVSSVRQSTFAPDGTLTNWPIGFFAP